MKICNGNVPEPPGGKYCNLEPDDCKAYGKVYKDEYGYTCANCGKRVSKWIPFTLEAIK